MLREKILKCVQDGNADLEKKVNDLQQMLTDFSSGHTQELLKVEELLSKLEDYDFVSSEYVLDTITCLSTKKKRILLCGFYGGQNLGDELMLQSLLHRLNNGKFDITIMLARHVEVDASIYAPFQVIHYPVRNDDILLLAKNYDYIIWGGGAVLDDKYYEYYHKGSSLGYILLKLSLAAIRLKKEVFVLGVSTNHMLKNSSFIEDLQMVIDKSSFFSLRDTNSLDSLKRAGLNTGNIDIIDDLVVPDTPKVVLSKPSGSAEYCLGMVFIFDNKNSSKVERFLRIIIENKASWGIQHLKINFIPFYNQGGSDKRHLQNLISRLHNQKDVTFVVAEFPQTIDSLVDILSQCDCILSMRYHAVLISVLCGISTISIDYSDEHRHYYNKLQYIAQHYGSFEKIPFHNIDDEREVFAVMKAALLQERRPKIDEKRVDKANKKLLSILRNFQ